MARDGLVDHTVYVERPLPVTSLVKFLFGRADSEGRVRWKRVISNRSLVMRAGKNVSVLTTLAPLPPVGPATPIRLSELVRDRLLKSQLARHESQKDSVSPIVWISHPQISVDSIRSLNPGLLWYDCTEDFAAWPGLSTYTRAQIEATDHWIMEHADVVTTVYRTLYQEKLRLNPRTYWLPNAVDTEVFSQPSGSWPRPLELQAVSSPVLTFVGGLNEWAHDWELLDQVAAMRPHWAILLIGEVSASVKRQGLLRSHSNVRCIGQKPYHELPAYLAHSDVCFQFYKQGRGNDTRNSQKMFLYFASGKPVVSTPSADALEYADCVLLADNSASFAAAVEVALSLDTPRKAEERQELSRANSWHVRLKQIGNILDSATVKPRPQ
ncbi:MAG: glycosyltransferase [Candidatus Marsarchaeota archaeon]|nr:glycosyltransferase [Candidatus Marsarchaeota archaeon]